MTIDEFIIELSVVRDQFKWYLDRNRIRAKWKITPQCHCCTSNDIFCPITALAHVKIKKTYITSAYPRAGEAMNMEKNVYCTIGYAADFTDKYQELRSKLLAELGLKQ